MGAGDGVSSVTFLLFAFGAWTWWKGGRRSLLVLWLAPFALNLLAAALHRYPYGGGCRLCQHLAPAVCLLAGTGIAALLERFIRSDALRMRWAVGLSVVLGLCAVGGLVCDVVYPYRDPETRWLADMPGKVLASMRPGDPLVVAQIGATCRRRSGGIWSRGIGTFAGMGQSTGIIWRRIGKL